MIPKKIHYCWFGGNPLSELAVRCMETWKKHLPDYELVEWNETNFDMNCNAYVKEAYQAKKWAFVSDYVRLHALHEQGGFYLDTDVEVIGSFDSLLHHPAVLGFESQTDILTSTIGAQKGSSLIAFLMSYYDDRHFIKEDGSFDMVTNVATITDMIGKTYPVELNNTYQEQEAFTLFPKEYFCPKDYISGKLSLTDRSLAIHHFNASWWSDDMQKASRQYKFMVKLFGKKRGMLANSFLCQCQQNGWHKTFCKIARLSYIKLTLSLFRRFPMQEKILFSSLGDFSSNTRALYEYMVRQGLNRKYKMVWTVNNKKLLKRHRKPNVCFIKKEGFSPVNLYHQATARYLIWDNQPLYKRRAGQTSIYLNHGVPMKNVKGIINIGSLCDYALCQSEQILPLMAEQVSTEQERFVILGPPRGDQLFEKTSHLQSLGIRKSCNILWMPTFRKTVGGQRNDSDYEMPFGLPILRSQADIDRLQAFLEQKDISLVLKLHPEQDISVIQLNNSGHITILNNDQVLEQDIQLYHLVGEFDALVTDYSSIFFDYLLLDRPIGFTLDDFDQYKLGFCYDDPLSMMPGEKIYNLEQLLAFLEQVADHIDVHAQERKRVRDYTNSYQDDQNCRRFVEHFNLA